MNMKMLVEQLNRYRDAYYNHDTMLVSDEVYDNLFDELKALEENTGIVMSNSPTQTVGYTVQDKLNRVKHSHLMLSLDKTKDVATVIKFAKNQNIIASLKMDGLTCSLHYNEAGKLVSAETRGNGEIGEDVYENAKQISNIPLTINNNGIPLTVDGEVIVDYDTFNTINDRLDDKYSHPRNLASGSIRQLDTKITKERNLKFIPWKVIDGINCNSFSKRLLELAQFGFEVVPFQMIVNNMTDETVFSETIDFLKTEADTKKYPIDGLVFTYDDIEYGESLGNTGHHPRHSLAFKFYDDCYETILKDIEWQVSRTGLINPVAIFEPVDLDGAITTRATLHNISVMKELKLGIGDTITVYRANQVIPKIKENLTKSDTYTYPTTCPVCGQPIEIRKDGIAEFMYCTNEDCRAKLVSKFTHFCSKPCMDIDGLSEATLEKFINLGYLTDFKSLYSLSKYKHQIVNLDGFGTTSYNKLIKFIENSRNVKLENFINALGINNIGLSTAKDLSKLVGGDIDKLVNKLANKEDLGLGNVITKSIYDWFNNRPSIEKDIEKELYFVIENTQEPIYNSFICDKIFTVTGAFKTMKRSELEALIEKHGGKLAGSVSKKTDYLLTNETTGTTKYNKALELNIPIMNEEEFISKLNGGK